MTEVLFYQLDRQPLDRVLVQLLTVTLGRGMKAAVQASSKERIAALDGHLWTHSDESFLPHGTKADGEPETQPIYLTEENDNPNQAQYRFYIDGAEIGELSQYERAIYIFDGRLADELELARSRWREIKAAGHEATYWRQNDNGRWEKQA